VRLEELLTGLAVDDAEAAHSFRDDDDDLRYAQGCCYDRHDFLGALLVSTQPFSLTCCPVLSTFVSFLYLATRSYLYPCPPAVFFVLDMNQVFGRAIRAGFRHCKSGGGQCHVSRFQSRCRGVPGRRGLNGSCEWRWVQLGDCQQQWQGQHESGQEEEVRNKR
jgi:hypothetical protein